MFERLRKAYREATDYDNWTVEDWKNDRWVMQVLVAFAFGLVLGSSVLSYGLTILTLAPLVVIIGLWLSMEYYYKREIRKVADNA